MAFSSLNNLKRRIRYFSGALQSMARYGGKAEAIRGAARFLLQKPSDAVRFLRWRALCAGMNLDRAVLDFGKFRLAVDAKDDGIAAELALDRMHEPYGTRILQSILRDGMTVVELGANIGYYTMQECAQCHLARVVAIEPNPASFEILKENVAINGLEGVSLYNLAVSDACGTLPFYISTHSNICSVTPRKDYARKIDVDVVTLDELVAREGVAHVDLIRMDIEGHEVHALKGMLETLRRDKPWLCMEYHSTLIPDNEREYFIETLEALGYALKCFTFRWSDYPIFGRTIVDRRNIVHEGELRDVLEHVTKQVVLLFLAPRESAFCVPAM